jgi:hypothetical protein
MSCPKEKQQKKWHIKQRTASDYYRRCRAEQQRQFPEISKETTKANGKYKLNEAHTKHLIKFIEERPYCCS